MDDLISRQAAIDAVEELCKHYTPIKSVKHPHMDFVIAELNDLPSIQPKNGKWEEIKVFPASEIELQSARCSACKRYHTTPYLYNYTHYTFCPHCGARMVNEDEID